MLLQLSTWKEIEAYLERSTGIIIPTGSTEQHGPNGLIGTDAICAEAVARGVGEEHGVLVGPTIELGVAQFNLGFPGTVTMRARTLMALVEDYVRSLAGQGFERFYFLNGHGGNINPIRAAFQDIYADRSMTAGLGNRGGVRCRLRSWWEYETADKLRHDLYGEWEGFHATPSEVAMTQHVFPDAIKNVAMEKPRHVADTFYRDFGGDNHFDAADHRRKFPDGRIASDPSLATPEAGKKLIGAAVGDAFADYQAFLDED